MASSIRLSCGDADAEIACLGAEVRTWRVAGRPLLWSPDAQVWPDVAPILFPVVGWTRGGQVRVGDRLYPLGLHGFARTASFKVERQSGDALCLRLDSNAETRALYPFDFTLFVAFDLTPSMLAISLTVENRGIRPMPYACGLHPGFCWPFSGGDVADYDIVFDVDEEPHVPRITAQGLFSRDTRPLDLQGRTLHLTQDLFAQEALCFLDARSHGLWFRHKNGSSLRIEVEDFPHFALWSRPHAPFLALETWTGHGDPDAFDGDLFAKPSMRVLAPGVSARHAARWIFAMGNDRI